MSDTPTLTCFNKRLHVLVILRQPGDNGNLFDGWPSSKLEEEIRCQIN